MKALSAIAVALLMLSGCTSEAAPQQAKAVPDVEETHIPVPVLKVGQPAGIDLMGDGRATITIAGAEVSKLDAGNDRLVVTIDIVLDKAGKPTMGGPENFRFRDNGAVLHKAQTDEQAFPPKLPLLNFTTAGQATHGRLFFDVPTGSAAGGHIQLMTGALVHAVWTV